MFKFMLKTSVIVLIGFAAIFTSCKKDQQDEVLFPNQTVQSDTNYEISSGELDSAYSDTYAEFKSSKGSSIWDATSFNQIPSQTFKFNSRYKYSYQHLKQKDGECSWTSYVIATGCIVEAHNNCYPISYSQVTRVKNGCGGSSYIGNLQDYGNSKDKSLARFNLGSEENKLDFVKGMLNHINNYHAPFLTITSIGSKGHYVIVFAIDWKKGLNGSTIYYMDPNERDRGAFYDNLRTMDLSAFLNTMICPPYTSMYNALFIKPR